MARGAATVNEQAIDAGDGAAITAEKALEIVATTDNTEILLFDLSSIVLQG